MSKAEEILFSKVTKDEWQNPIWKESAVLAAMKEIAELSFKNGQSYEHYTLNKEVYERLNIIPPNKETFINNLFKE